MIDGAAATRTDVCGSPWGGTRADVIAVVKAICCGGSQASVTQHAPKLQKYLPDNWERDYWRASEVIWGDTIAADRSFGNVARYWATNGDDTPCHEAGLLVNATSCCAER